MADRRALGGRVLSRRSDVADAIQAFATANQHRLATFVDFLVQDAGEGSVSSGSEHGALPYETAPLSGGKMKSVRAGRVRTLDEIRHPDQFAVAEAPREPYAGAVIRYYGSPYRGNAAMADSARFALHRPEHTCALERGDAKIARRLAGSAMHVAAGTNLIRAGTEHDYVYRLREGWAGRTRSLEDARSQFILIFLPGDLFAVKSMFVLRHPDDVIAISDLSLERISYKELYAAYASDSDVASRCTWQVMEEERRLHSWVVGLGQGSAEERLAMLLIDFRGRLILSGVIPGGALTFAMPLTHVQLAEHLGITAVHVNRVLKMLRDRSIVSINDHVVMISDLDALVKIGSVLLDPFERSCPAYVGEHRAHLTKHQ